MKFETALNLQDGQTFLREGATARKLRNWIDDDGEPSLDYELTEGELQGIRFVDRRGDATYQMAG